MSVGVFLCIDIGVSFTGDAIQTNQCLVLEEINVRL